MVMPCKLNEAIQLFIFCVTNKTSKDVIEKTNFFHLRAFDMLLIIFVQKCKQNTENKNLSQALKYLLKEL